jgi:DNA-binding NarL/FixJ family response regulator
MTRPRILLADDHTLLTDAFRKLLEPDFEIIGAVTDGQKLLSDAVQLAPDVILVDLGLPLLNGLDAGQMLKRLLPKAKLLVVTMNEDVAVAQKALRWASGYLLKKAAGAELVHAIRELIAGRTYIAPAVARQLEYRFINDPSWDGDKALTFRQREVLQLLAEGLSMKEAADKLKLTPRTVAFHKYRIMEEFGLHNNSELLKLALRENLMVP